MTMETSPVAAALPAAAVARNAAGVARNTAAAPPNNARGNISRILSPLPHLHRSALEASADQAVPGSLNSTRDYSVVDDSMAAEVSGRGGGSGGKGKAKAAEAKKGARKPTKRKSASPPSEKNSENSENVVVKSVKRQRK